MVMRRPSDSNEAMNIVTHIMAQKPVRFTDDGRIPSNKIVNTQ